MELAIGISNHIAFPPHVKHAAVGPAVGGKDAAVRRRAVGKAHVQAVHGAVLIPALGGNQLAACGGSLYPLVIGGGVGKLIFAHPALGVGGTAPVVHQNAARGGGQRVIRAGIHRVNSLAVHIPGDRVLTPAEAVLVELLGGVKAQVVPVLVAALAVHKIVELNPGGVLAQKLNVDFVPGIGVALRVDVVGTGAGEEGAGGALRLGRLHLYDVVAIAVVQPRAGLAAIVALFHLSLGVGDSQVELAVGISNHIALPPHVKHAAVGPAVGGKDTAVRRRAVGKVGQHNGLKGGRRSAGGGGVGGGGAAGLIAGGGAGRQRCGHGQGQQHCKNLLFHRSFLLLTFYSQRVAALCDRMLKPDVPGLDFYVCYKGFTPRIALSGNNIIKGTPAGNGRSLNCTIFTYFAARSQARSNFLPNCSFMWQD